MMRGVVFVAATAMAVVPASAWAHAMLVHASPAAGARGPAPAEVQLQLSENLEPAFSAVTVSDIAGHTVTAAAPVVSGHAMRVKLKPLAPGTYKVRWHAVSVDTHRTEGAFTFIVQ